MVGTNTGTSTVLYSEFRSTSIECILCQTNQQKFMIIKEKMINYSLRRCCSRSGTCIINNITAECFRLTLPGRNNESKIRNSGYRFCHGNASRIQQQLRLFSSSRYFGDRYDDDDDDDGPSQIRHGVYLGTRRRRPKEPLNQEGAYYPFRDSSGLDKALATSMNSPNDNNDTLSPWTPAPDIVARRALEMAEAGPDDIHIDLGCGDGRVNFHALDMCSVKRTIGIDYDKAVIDAAVTRLKKRHPLPSNIKFVEANIMDSNSIIWDDYVKDATIITMYFATEGLKKFRPVLEQKLRSRTDECTIVCIGYKMPGWRTTSMQSEVVLGTQIHLYRWGSGEITDPFLDPLLDMLIDTDEDETINKNSSHSAASNAKKRISSTTRFNGANVTDMRSKFPIQGFNLDNLLVGQKHSDDFDESWLDAANDPFVLEDDELQEERQLGSIQSSNNSDGFNQDNKK
jgi:SAM-dependent methyltransferase